MNLLLVTGVMVFLGTFGARIFQQLKIPQVVGYITVGLFLGGSVFNLCDQTVIARFEFITSLTLGIIGFIIGAELKLELFRKQGKTIWSILLAEGVITFFVVTALITVLSGKFYLGLLLGALAAATAPAATVDVLWEYKARGILTSTVFAIVALDDALALIIYGFASVFARALITSEHAPLLHSIEAPFIEIGMAILVGSIAGYVLFWVLKSIRDRERILPFTLGIILFTTGVSLALKVDLILSSMVLGFVLVNIAPIDTKDVIEVLKKFSTPLYVIFFVLVGARVNLSLFLKSTVVILALGYVLARTLGKFSGAFLGGLIGKAQPVVTKYLGFCLFSQAGVAIGLAISLEHSLSLIGPQPAEIGMLIVNVIAATTFIVQMVGPSAVKFAINRAKEVGRDITEEDIINEYKVEDFMKREQLVIKENMSLPQVFAVVKESRASSYCVVDNKNRLKGIITLDNLRAFFTEHDAALDQLILARDIAVAPNHYISANQPLKEAVFIFRRRQIDFICVVDNEKDFRLAGIMQYRSVMRKINQELVVRKGDS